MNGFANPVVRLLGRRLRLGVVGGGPGFFIGTVHRAAARLDDRYEGVAAVLSSAARLTGNAADPLALDFPAAEDGARGMRFVEAALESRDSDGRWTDWSLSL